MPRLSLAGGLRLACGVVLVGLLLWQASRGETLAQLRENPPHLGWLAASLAVLVAAIVLSFLRWRQVVAAAGIEITVAEAVRLGAVGYACNFVALGSVGGDVVKAALLARPRPGQRTAAVSSIFVDRLLGLLGYLSFAAAAILATGFAFGAEATPLRLLCRSTLAVAGVAAAAFVAAVAPGRPIERLAAAFGATPLVGPLAQQAAELAATYHNGRRRLVGALAIGVVMNGVYVLAFYAAARSLPLVTPGLAEHFLVVPLAAISGTLPISPNGLGTVEATAEYLYRALQPDARVGAGTLAALAHRLTTLVAGVLAAAYYSLISGRRLDEAIAETTNESTIAEGSGTEEPDSA